MPNYVPRTVNTFVKGLITEAGELTFPENASVDELNCDLFRDGSRRRRKAIAFEDNNENSTFSVSANTHLNFGEWRNVGGDSGKNFLVVQVNDTLYFYDKTVFPFSSGEITNSVSLSAYSTGPTGTDFTYDCDFASIFGYLVVVSEKTEPIYIEADSSNNFTVTQFDCRVRDFKWLGDRKTYTSDVATGSITAQRFYDTKNAGWVGVGLTALSTYATAKSTYPKLTHPWYSGKDSSGNFSVAEWDKIDPASSLIGNGHYILDLFVKDRSTVSGVAGLTTETEASRFKTNTAFAGRVFFGGLQSVENTGRVFFSPILESITDIGEFIQRNDPTSEISSVLLDNDGGVIVIPDAYNIIKLYAFRNSIFVMAENGIWQIRGLEDVFKPTGYSVSRLSETGILSKNSFVAVEGVPFWWSSVGIHTLSFDEFGNATVEDLTAATIQSFWDDISVPSKETVQATYDRINKKVYWLYKNDGETTNKYNKVLVLDVTLQAFYPWTFSDSQFDTDYVLGCQFYKGFTSAETEFDVYSNGSDVQSNGSDVVSTELQEIEDANVSVVFFCRDTSKDRLTMGLVNSNTYLDWGNADFTSFAEGGYDFLEDTITRKTAPYIITYMRETETGWTGDETNGYTPANDSSMLVSAFWDFSKTASSTPQQAYRRKRAVFPFFEQSVFLSEESVIQTRLKMRGRGRVMKIRFESETGKDFIYLGHGLIGDAAGRF